MNLYFSDGTGVNEKIVGITNGHDVEEVIRLLKDENTQLKKKLTGLSLSLD